jgi:hypothetical protein
MKNLHEHLGDRQELKNFPGAIYLLALFACVLVFSGFAIAPKTITSRSKMFYADSSGNGTAAPLAKFKKDADSWFKKMGTTKQKWLSQIPSEKKLGVPVYPGAVITVYQQGYHDSQETLLPELVLASPDPAKKIEAWYAEKLKGWNHNKTYHAFLPPHKNVDVMSDKYNATQHVEIEKAMSKNQFDGMFLKQPANTKTGIIIRY